MYDNLTVEDIVSVWSRVHLDHVIEVAADLDHPRRSREMDPTPLPFHIKIHTALWLENQRKRSFLQILTGATS